jgi:hypothetical protein
LHAGVESGGTFTRNPVAWAGSGTVRTLLGKGPTVVEEDWKSAVVGAAKTQTFRRKKTKNAFITVVEL